MAFFYAAFIAVAVFIAVFGAIAFFLGGILGHLRHGSLNGYRVQLVKPTPVDNPPRRMNTFLSEQPTEGFNDHSTPTGIRHR